jgi:hypothetical protein
MKNIDPGTGFGSRRPSNHRPCQDLPAQALQYVPDCWVVTYHMTDHTRVVTMLNQSERMRTTKMIVGRRELIIDPARQEQSFKSCVYKLEENDNRPLK